MGIRSALYNYDSHLLPFITDNISIHDWVKVFQFPLLYDISFAIIFNLTAEFDCQILWSIGYQY